MFGPYLYDKILIKYKFWAFNNHQGSMIPFSDSGPFILIDQLFPDLPRISPCFLGRLFNFSISLLKTNLINEEQVAIPCAR